LLIDFEGTALIKGNIIPERSSKSLRDEIGSGTGKSEEPCKKWPAPSHELPFHAMKKNLIL
jgi:hypothetical protein